MDFSEIGLEVEETAVFDKKVVCIGNGNEIIVLIQLDEESEYTLPLLVSMNCLGNTEGDTPMESHIHCTGAYKVCHFVGMSVIEMRMGEEGPVMQRIEVKFAIDANSIQEAIEGFDAAFEKHVEDKEAEAEEEASRIVQAPPGAMGLLDKIPYHPSHETGFMGSAESRFPEG